MEDLNVLWSSLLHKRVRDLFALYSKISNKLLQKHEKQSFALGNALVFRKDSLFWLRRFQWYKGLVLRILKKKDKKS